MTGKEDSRNAGGDEAAAELGKGLKKCRAVVEDYRAALSKDKNAPPQPSGTPVEQRTAPSSHTMPGLQKDS